MFCRAVPFAPFYKVEMNLQERGKRGNTFKMLVLRKTRSGALIYLVVETIEIEVGNPECGFRQDMSRADHIFAARKMRENLKEDRKWWISSCILEPQKGMKYVARVAL